MECVFCKIIAGEIPSYRVYEDEGAYAFLDINPIARGHTLVISRAHASKVTELSAQEAAGVALALQKVVRGVERALGPEGLNIFVNQGEVAGQVIPHFHIHVVPRSRGDDVRFVTPTVELSEEEFRELSGAIARAI